MGSTVYCCWLFPSDLWSIVHCTKPTEGDSGLRLAVMSALTEANKVRGQTQRQSVRGLYIWMAKLTFFFFSLLSIPGNITENAIDVSSRSLDEIYIHTN